MSESIKSILQNPIFFEQNRVGRVYLGGAGFADFFGDDSTDGFEPEEWVVSSVKAINKVIRREKEGVSKIKGTDIFFDTLLENHKKELLGNRESFSVLTKVLDSAIRLPVQAHPDKEFSRKHFNSEYGKAESWIVLATRPDACIYFGFKDKISKQEFAQAVEQSKTDKTAMEKLLNKIPAHVGDVYFVPAKMVHAIGYGCLILEIQEPTDFTIQPEYYCGDYLLNDREMYIGLDHDIALDVFDYSVFGQDAIKLGKKTPIVFENSNGIKAEHLITYKDTPCFAVDRYTVTSSQLEIKDKPAVYVVTDGCGEIVCNNNCTPIKKGDYFFLGCSAGACQIKSSDKIEFIVCLPPQE